MSKQLKITTIDNPYDPFNEFEKWFLYDVNKGYHTCSRLASIIRLSDTLSEEEIYIEMERGFKILSRTGAFDKNGNIIEFKKVIKE